MISYLTFELSGPKGRSLFGSGGASVAGGTYLNDLLSFTRNVSTYAILLPRAPQPVLGIPNGVEC